MFCINISLAFSIAYLGGDFMKNSNKHHFSDEISGKESEDYTGEFAPYRLTVTEFEESCDFIFDNDENNPILSP